MTIRRDRARVWSWLVAPLISGALLACPAVAHAQSAEDVATAKDAIRQARELRGRGDYAGALPKFKAAYALVPTPLTGLDLGKTHLKLGQPVEALEVFVAVTQMPHADTESSIHRDSRAEAARLAAELRAKIPTLTIVLSAAPSGTPPNVTVDDHDVPPASLSVPRRVNPGHHIVKAALPGVPPATQEIDVREGETREVKIDLGAGIAAPPPATPHPSSPPDVSPPPATSATGHGLGGRRIAALVVGGVGAAVVGVGAYLNLTGKSNYYEVANNSCSKGICPDWDTANQAQRAANQGTIGMVVLGAGVLVLGGAATLWLTAPSPQASGSLVQPSVAVSLLPGGVALRGGF